eukprot:INCI16967.1.p1 GENE.INCI16967.1~~INCI16967.1.p1  ORF type:complete len:411 (+),score=64.02 INCI16967.1:77-1234(+)
MAAKTTIGLAEGAVRELLQGRRFHQLSDPNPTTAADVTSTWTIPCAGKDELIFNNDGTYVFTAHVCFLGGNGQTLSRAGRGRWTLQEAQIVAGEWIALHLSQKAKASASPAVSATATATAITVPSTSSTSLLEPEDFVGKRLWQVVIHGPDLGQEGEAMDMDDVNECGVLTEFVDEAAADRPGAKKADSGGGDDDDDDDMPTLTGVASQSSDSKRIRTMTWWVDDVLSWTNEPWLGEAHARQQEHRRRNPKFPGLGKGFLNKQQRQPHSPDDAVAFSGTKDEGAVTTKALAATNAPLEFQEFENEAAPKGLAQEEAYNVRNRRTNRVNSEKRLPPLVPKRMDVRTSADEPPRPPHTYCGWRVEDLSMMFLCVFFVAVIYWQVRDD